MTAPSDQFNVTAAITPVSPKTGDTLTLTISGGQPESSPFVYVASSSNGPVRVLGTTVATKGGTWTGLPQVHNAGSGPFIHDDLVTAA